MKDISLTESKKIMLDILKEVASFCDENNIVYFLAYGTLLGAVRHKGYIPWDDDIDIMMPRPDYERFVELYHQKGKYAISSPLVDKGCFYVYSKVYDERTIKFESGIDYSRYPAIGIDIDVFPLDGILEDKKLKHYLLYSIVLYRIGRLIARTIAPKHIFPSIKNRIADLTINPFCRIIGKDFFIKYYIKVATYYTYESSDNIYVAFPSLESIQTKYAKHLFASRIKIPFEDGEFWAPKGYDEYLRGSYGDYMQLPPVEKQKTHHKNIIFWRE